MTNVEICLVDLKMSFISYNYQKVEAWKNWFHTEGMANKRETADLQNVPALTLNELIC